MDVRRSINTKIWADDWFEALNPTEKLLWIYLLTNAQTNMLGIYEISIKRMSFETGIGQGQVDNTLKSFESVGKAFYWFGWIVLPNWMKNQSLNPNMITSAERIFDSLPKELIINLIDNGLEGFESLLKGCQTLPKKEKEKEKEKEIEIEKESESEIGTRTRNKDLFNKWVNEDNEAYEYINKFFPKMFLFRKPLKVNEHRSLCKKYTADRVMDIYGQMENKPDLLKKYESAYLTANNWLKR